MNFRIKIAINKVNLNIRNTFQILNLSHYEIYVDGFIYNYKKKYVCLLCLFS